MTCRFLLLLCLALLAGPGMAAPLKNALAGHASPYLALHGQDPVAWQEWNAETMARARRENKLLFVSVGYFSCHWCHVMQRESYRNPAIARLLNEHFIPVKVDRELNGALDAGLVAFAEAIKGVAGWPLNAFVTPEGYPAYVVLYEPPAEFERLLTRMAQTWREQGQAFRDAAREAGSTPRTPPAKGPVTPAAVQLAQQAFMEAVWQNADTLQGGFNRVSKFPMAAHLDVLLGLFAREPEPRLGEFLRITLDQMARLGLRDHVNGGFFRYTVDPDWSTPHFEKMLYDNAQLVRLYARAARVFQRPDYLRVAHTNLDFMLADLAAPGGGFYTALSALDRKGREGGAYLWTLEELRQRLSPSQYTLVKRVWGLKAAAPFALGYLPMERARPTTRERPVLDDVLANLRQAKRHAQVPVDTKLNAGFNGLALSALVEAGRGVPRYEQAAHRLKDFMMKRMVSQGRLLKARAGGRIFADAELEDYAFAAAGLTDYAKAFQDPHAKALARELAAQAWQRFFTPAAGWRREDQSLLATLLPEPAMADGALPSPAARLMGVTRALLREQPDHPLAQRLEQALSLLPPVLAQAPFDHPSDLALLRESTDI